MFEAARNKIWIFPFIVFVSIHITKAANFQDYGIIKYPDAPRNPKVPTFPSAPRYPESPKFAEAPNNPEAPKNSESYPPEASYNSEKINYPCGTTLRMPPQSKGGNSPRNGEYPWVATLGYKGIGTKDTIYSCSGSLISEYYVLTSGLCLQDSHLFRKPTHVRLGEYNLTSTVDCQIPLKDGKRGCFYGTKTSDIEIEKIFLHPGFNKQHLLSDNIGLVKLIQAVRPGSDLQKGFINTICIPSSKTNTRALLRGHEAISVGWDFGSGQPNDVIMQAKLVLADDDAICKNRFNGYNSEKQLCMRKSGSFKRCVGDSGSPLSLPDIDGSFVQVGLLSYGSLHCSEPGRPIVFTTISHYKDWIDEIISA